MDRASSFPLRTTRDLVPVLEEVVPGEAYRLLEALGFEVASPTVPEWNEGLHPDLLQTLLGTFVQVSRFDEPPSVETPASDMAADAWVSAFTWQVCGMLNSDLMLHDESGRQDASRVEERNRRDHPRLTLWGGAFRRRNTMRANEDWICFLDVVFPVFRCSQ